MFQIGRRALIAAPAARLRIPFLKKINSEKKKKELRKKMHHILYSGTASYK